tara:strand:- start:671 stop:1456 length:786 start_codon:yes stop_codon:yes gene_type:complete
MSFVPRKSLGQNFLLNQKIIKKIVDLGKLNNESTVIEIGPGTGNLTEEIIKKKPKDFFAIEKDINLFSQLNNKYKSDLILINQDVLTINWQSLIKNKCIVFGNLPYNISSKILINWIRLNNLNALFNRFILMFQKEVADRIVADVNSSNYGRLAILTAWKLNAKKIMDIDPENFFPKPKVKSSVIYFEPKRDFFNLKNSRNLEKVTDIFFQNRRKMIKKPINILFNEPSKIINKLNLDEKSRPQNLDFLTFLKISDEYENQ